MMDLNRLVLSVKDQSLKFEWFSSHRASGTRRRPAGSLGSTLAYATAGCFVFDARCVFARV